MRVWVDGQPIAPEQASVSVFDRGFLYGDSVFETIRKGIEDRPPVAPLTDVSDPTDLERVTNPDNAERTAIEAEYLAGTKESKRKLLRASLQAGSEAPTDLLRLAVFDLDEDLNRMARLALAQANEKTSIGLINESLRAPMSTEERAALIAALERLGERFPRAKTLAAVHKGLSADSDSVDLSSWSTALSANGAGSAPKTNCAKPSNASARI